MSVKIENIFKQKFHQTYHHGKTSGLTHEEALKKANENISEAIKEESKILKNQFQKIKHRLVAGVAVAGAAGLGAIALGYKALTGKKKSGKIMPEVEGKRQAEMLRQIQAQHENELQKSEQEEKELAAEQVRQQAEKAQQEELQRQQELEAQEKKAQALAQEQKQAELQRQEEARQTQAQKQEEQRVVAEQARQQALKILRQKQAVGVTTLGLALAGLKYKTGASLQDNQLAQALQGKDYSQVEKILSDSVKRGLKIDKNLAIEVFKQAVEQKNINAEFLALISVASMMNADEFKQFVVQQNIDINKVDTDGQTILSRAIALKNFELVQKIIGAGAKVSKQEQIKIDALQNTARKKWYQW